MSKDIRATLETPCCTFYDTGVTSTDLGSLQRVIGIAGARHGWQFHVVRDALDEEPVWRVYISGKVLTEEQCAEVKAQQGPVIVFKEIFDEFEIC